MGIDSIVSVDITTLTTSIAKAGFGTPLLSAYFPTSIFADRMRAYTKLSGMTDDGFPVTHPAYLMAQALKSQDPSIKTWKVGRKALPSAQVIRVTPTVTTEGEVVRLTVEGVEVTYTIPAAATVASIVTAVTALLDAVVGVSASDDTTHITLTPNKVLSTRLTVDTPDNAQDFVVTINGTAFTYTSDASGTVTEVRDGLEALITASSLPVTATDVSTDGLDIASTTEEGIEISETAAGAGAMSFSLDVDAYDLLSVAGPSKGLTLKDLTPDPGIATDLAAMLAEDTDHYGLQLDSESEPEILAAAAWVEANKTLFTPSTIDTETKDAAVTTDVGSDLKLAGYKRTGLIFSESSQQYGGARWMGVMFPKDPGSATWAYKKLAGFNTTVLTAAEELALDGKNINHYQLIKNAPFTQQGKAASGEWLDITRGADWFKARLQERLLLLKLNNDKLPFSDATGDLIRAEMLAQFEEARLKDVLLPNTADTPWVIDIPLAADVAAGDKATRLWPDIDFSGFLAGAVHRTQMQGALRV